MKKFTLLAVITLLMCGFTASAQFQPVGHLTVFSDSGAKFFLILNGERYNDVAETNIRVEELPNPYYACKIIFEDKNIPPISKNALMLTDVDEVFQDVTYRIKADKKGKYSLKFYSSVPAQQNIIRPANVPVYQYGHPGTAYIDNHGHVNETVVVQQTTTTTGDSFGMNVNMGGVGMSVSVPATMGSVTTTTTTTTSSSGTGGYSSHHGHDRDDDRNYNNNSNGCRRAMPANDFEQAKKAISDNGFDDTRLSMAKQIVSSNCMDSNQIAAIVKVISFDASKLDFAKYAYDFCTDKNNYYKVVNTFSFSTSKEELNDYIQNRR